MFTRAVILKAARFAKLAYDAPTHSHEDAQAFLGDQDGVQIVSIAGTNEPLDVLRDIAFECEERAGLGWLCDGFADYFDICREMLDKDVVGDPRPKLVIGHSLGGGSAHPYARHLKNLGLNVKRITFSCPRVWRPDCADSDTVDTVNIIHGCDWIPNMPPWLRRSGPDIFLSTSGVVLKAQQSFGWNPWRRITNRLTCSDHGIDPVIASLEKWVSSSESTF